MKVQKQELRSNHKLIGTLIILATLTALLLPPTIVYVNTRNSNTQTAADNTNTQIGSAQAACLNDTYNKYEKDWKAADKDGDEKVSYGDGASDITTAYYDAAIECYRTYKTNDSNEYIADYQAKRQQETDKYTAWLESSRQSTYVPTYNNDYRSSMSCRSNSIGSSVYTTCD